MNRTRRPAVRLAALAGFALLVGCQHQSTPAPPPEQQVETGSRFVLRSPLTFPAGASELFFQNEQVVAAGKLAQTMPYCRLAARSGPPGVVQPGTFTVSTVDYDEKEIGTTRGMVNVTRIALAADPKQAGYVLSCGWPEGAPSRAFVNTEQIFNAIGGQFSMNLLR